MSHQSPYRKKSRFILYLKSPHLHPSALDQWPILSLVQDLVTTDGIAPKTADRGRSHSPLWPRRWSPHWCTGCCWPQSQGCLLSQGFFGRCCALLRSRELSLLRWGRLSPLLGAWLSSLYNSALSRTHRKTWRVASWGSRKSCTERRGWCDHSLSQEWGLCKTCGSNH